VGAFVEVMEDEMEVGMERTLDCRLQIVEMKVEACQRRSLGLSKLLVPARSFVDL